jgi:hypothetical protein
MSSLLLLLSGTLGGAIIGLIATAVIVIARTRLDAWGSAPLAYPIYIVAMSALGGIIGGLLAFTFTAGWLWLGRVGVLGVSFAWILTGIVWASLRWFRDHGY